MKYCPGCKINKQLDEFAKNKTKTCGVQSYCKQCKPLHDHKYYLTHKVAHIQRVRRYILTNKQNLWKYLLEHPCVDCGENNPVVLEFDHLEDKVRSIAEMMGRKSSWNSITQEIKKCVVRCANCHRIKTANELGWYKFIIVDKLGSVAQR